MKLEKRRSFIINFLYFAIILGIIILLTRYALGAIALFLIALAVSFLLKPAVQYFCEKLRIPRGISGLVLVVLFYALLGFLFTVIGVQLFSAAKSFFLTLPPLYTGSVAPWMSRQFVLIQEFVGKLDPEATAAYNALAASINSSLGNESPGSRVRWLRRLRVLR